MSEVEAWAIDFTRAIQSRRRWVRLLLRCLMGRYAYRELVGLMEALEARGVSMHGVTYELQGQQYHNDSVPKDFL